MRNEGKERGGDGKGSRDWSGKKSFVVCDPHGCYTRTEAGLAPDHKARQLFLLVGVVSWLIYSARQLFCS